MTSRLIYSTVIYAAGEQRELDSCIAVSANCGERERRSSGSHGSLVATRPRGAVCHHSFPGSAGTGHTAPCRRWIDLTAVWPVQERPKHSTLHEWMGLKWKIKLFRLAICKKKKERGNPPPKKEKNRQCNDVSYFELHWSARLRVTNRAERPQKKRNISMRYVAINKFLPLAHLFT